MFKLNKLADRTYSSGNGIPEIDKYREAIDSSFEAFEQSFTSHQPVLMKANSQEFVSRSDNRQYSNNRL